MSHCAPEATLKRSEFTPKTVIGPNWCLRRASVLGGCSKDVARRQQIFCRQMCCSSVEQHTICRWTSAVDVLDLTLFFSTKLGIKPSNWFSRKWF